MELVDPARQEALTRLNREVAEHYHAGRYAQAVQAAERYVAEARGIGDDHPAYAAAISSLAMAQRALGRHAEAEPLAKRALVIDEKTLGPDHPNVAGDLDNLAQLYQEQDRHAEAEPLYRRVLAVTERAFGPEHPRVAGALNNLAWQYRALGRYAEAEPLVRRALAISEKALGPEHADIGRFLDTLALLHEGQGRMDEAEQSYERALAILEKALGHAHPDVAIVRGNLGGLYKSRGRLAEAAPLLESVWAINERALGSGHPSLARSLAQVADLYRLQGRCDKADSLFLRARSIGAAAMEEVAVLFGTDRQRDASRPTVAFGSERHTGLSIGLTIVTLPKEQVHRQVMRQPGTQDPAAGTRLSSEARRLAMHCIQVMSNEEIISAGMRHVSTSKSHPNQALVFVHGYNVSFESAIRRTAQIAYDVKFDGGAFLFSWPARGSFMDYFSDRDTVDIAAGHLREFLESIVGETKVTKIHFIAHSMGNMVVLRALEEIVREGSTLGSVIGEVVNAAPDVDPDVFAQMVRKIKARGANFTLYASRKDKALWLSSWMRDRPRAGYIKDIPLIVLDRARKATLVDTIDITEAGSSGWYDLFGLDHDVYSSSPIVVADMRRIFERGERPPDVRTKEFRPVVLQQGKYWRLVAPPPEPSK